jgi:glutamyl-tRNA synthetase
VDDHCLRVSHVFRGKEHEHNTAVQALIYGSFGWKQPETVNFGMIYMPGEKLHTRDIKEKIARGEISDWDDPRLHTIRAFLRRGFRPEALKAYAKDCSLTKTDIRINMDSLETHNRRLIDPKADRYMTVLEPEAIIVEGLKKKDAHLIVHPNFPERGKRNVAVEPSSMWISGQDFMQLRGRTIRLKELGNVKLGKNAVYEGNEIVQDMPKIQWVSVPHIKVKVLMPDGSAREGLGEPAMGQLKAGSIIQMERTGFARVDKVEDGMVTLVFAHK